MKECSGEYDPYNHLVGDDYALCRPLRHHVTELHREGSQWTAVRRGYMTDDTVRDLVARCGDSIRWLATGCLVVWTTQKEAFVIERGIESSIGDILRDLVKISMCALFAALHLGARPPPSRRKQLAVDLHTILYSKSMPECSQQKSGIGAR